MALFFCRLSVNQLLNFCRDLNDIPFDGHRYLTGECYYGGKLTDINDKRLLLTLLDQYFSGSPEELNIPNTPLKDTFLKFIKSISTNRSVELTGLHQNANDFYKSITESNSLIHGTMMSQREFLEMHKQQIEHGISRSGILATCEAMLGKLPELPNLRLVQDNFPMNGSNALNIVLFNEVVQYHAKCKYLSDSLNEVIRMLKGEVNSTAELIEVHESITRQRVPEKWKETVFITKKNLSGFVKELVERIKFFKSWIEDGEPTTMWIGAFLCPQALFEALRWNFSKHSQKSVNLVTMRISPTKFESKNRQSSLEYSDFCRVS